jgi:hypothetical protein
MHKDTDIFLRLWLSVGVAKSLKAPDINYFVEKREQKEILLG